MNEVMVEQVPHRPRPSEGCTAEWWDTHERRALAVAKLSLVGADWLVEHPEVELPTIQ